MVSSFHVPLFHPRLVRERVASVPPSLFAAHRSALQVWLDHLKKGTLDETKEVSLHGPFLERIFGDVLGYRTMALAEAGTWDLTAEKSVIHGGSADGAIGFFEKKKSYIVAPIELKGASQFLEHNKGRALTPVQQGWDYANKAPTSRWIIVSNYRETRLYSKSVGPGAYELFHLASLGEPEGFARFIALLGREALLGGGPPGDTSPLAQMLVASEQAERDVTKRLYAHYRGIRVRLFDHLQRVNPGYLPGELLSYAQTILDRIIFLAFAEDRGLLDPKTIENAYSHRDPYQPRPIWQNFLAVFRAVDRGSTPLRVPAYNGGLFRHEPAIDKLEVSDEACGWFNDLAAYDFREDVSVDVLGHIFEQSIVDLEDLRREASRLHGDDSEEPRIAPDRSTQKRPSKRRTEGIFYTPSFVTAFLVRETIGQAFAEAWERATVGKGLSRKERLLAWEAYQEELRMIRVLDPACGSGAFLAAAFDAIAQEFERANRALAELKGNQASLFDLTKTVLNESLFGLDINPESVEITRLSLWLKTAERNKKLTYLDRNVRRGNSVVSDSSLDAFAFDWKRGRVAQRSLEHLVVGEDGKAIDARWRGGFDVVIGNPPYVRQELLTAYKSHWKDNFESYDGLADLFVYFFERSFQVLKPGGRLGFIVSNKWLRGGYAERLRAFLARKATVERIVDFGHAPIFPDADAFPCIIVLRKDVPESTHTVSVTLYPREELGKDVLASYVESHRFELPQAALGHAPWALEPPSVAALVEKIRHAGKPLGEFAGTKPYYGVKTGCNEAFLIDQATRDRLVRQDPRSAELLKKYLRGQDMDRWAAAWTGLWMIFARRGVKIDEYPAIKAHLETYREQLEPRPSDFSGSVWPGRKPGTYKWYELQDAVDYFDLFEKPKIVVHRYMFHPTFCVIEPGMFINDASAFVPTDDKWLLATLNSPAFWYFAFRTFPHKKDETIAMDQQCVMTAPVPPPSPLARATVTAAVERLIKCVAANLGQTRLILDFLRVEHGVDTPGNALSEPVKLSRDGFVAAVKKRQPKGKPLTPATLSNLRGVYTAEIEPMQVRATEICGLERKVVVEVHRAYGLTPEDEALLWETAPPRMPVGRG